MDTTPRKRSAIIALYQNTSMTQRELAIKFGVGVGTINRIIQRYKQTGSISPKKTGNCGRKKKTTPTDDRFLLRKSKLNPRLFAVDLARELGERGVNLHVSNVRRRLLLAGRKACKPVKKHLLTGEMRKKRLLWARSHQDWTVEHWKTVLFSDESYFQVQGQRVQYVRRANNEATTSHHLQQTVKHPVQKMFWGCFTHEGLGPLVPVEGMMKSDQYIQILQRRVVPELQKRFPDGNGIFQQDLAPCHTLKKVKFFFSDNNICVLEWPGNSPDINPIENLWAICKRRLAKLDCSTKTRMIESLIKVWFHDDELKNMCSKLVKSMPNRVKELIKHKGGHITY